MNGLISENAHPDQGLCCPQSGPFSSAVNHNIHLASDNTFALIAVSDNNFTLIVVTSLLYFHYNNTKKRLMALWTFFFFFFLK